MIGAWLFAACAGGGGDESGEGAGSSVVSTETFTATSDRDGYVEIPVEIEAGEVFQVVVEGRRSLYSTDYALAPDGGAAFDWEDWYDAYESLTGALYPTQGQTSFDWPVRASDGPLEAGEWTVKVATLNNNYEYDPGVDVDVTVLVRPEPDPAAGTLRTVVAYAGDLSSDAAVVAGVEAAVAWWQEIYAAIGIDLQVTYTDIALDPALGWADDGEEEIEALLAGQDGMATLLVVGDEIAGDDWLYGMAAAIPGAYSATPRSVVYLSWLVHAGANGELSEGEVLQMGETMAHETGHYLGLFHPVEDGGTDEWVWIDALDDTADCGSWQTCEDQLGANLMFPYPVCTSRCVRQSELTAEQGVVANQWVGVE